MIDKAYIYDKNNVKELPPTPDLVDQLEQQSRYDEIEPAKSTPTRVQQERDRHNTDQAGQVDIEGTSTSRHSLKSTNHRDSWFLRIDNSAKNVIRRASASTYKEEKKIINRVADSINNYGDHHQDDSWTDKVLNFLFPSMELRPHTRSSPTSSPIPPLMPLSDDVSEAIQQQVEEDCIKETQEEEEEEEEQRSCDNETSDTVDILDQTTISTKSRSSSASDHP